MKQTGESSLLELSSREVIEEHVLNVGVVRAGGVRLGSQLETVKIISINVCQFLPLYARLGPSSSG